MGWFNKLWKWLVGILTIIGAIAVYALSNQNEAQKRVAKIEEEIKEIEKDIKVKEKERKKLIKDADGHAEAGKDIDKKIEKAKKQKESLDNKRDKMKSIFDKYNTGK